MAIFNSYVKLPGVSWLVDGLGWTPALHNSRTALQILISHILRYRNNRAAAAGIAGLVGNCSISEAAPMQAVSQFQLVKDHVMIMLYHEETSRIYSARATRQHNTHIHTYIYNII